MKSDAINGFPGGGAELVMTLELIAQNRQVRMGKITPTLLKVKQM